MIINKQKTESGAWIYEVCSDVRETGARGPHTIAQFDSLATAAAVLKYLRGDKMTYEDQQTAAKAIREIDYQE